MNQSKYKLALGIIVLALVANGIFFLLDASKSEIVDPPESQQIIIPEPEIDTISYDTVSNKR
jgi:hypothetical protein